MKTLATLQLCLVISFFLSAQNTPFPSGEAFPKWQVNWEDGLLNEEGVDIWRGGTVLDTCGGLWTSILFGDQEFNSEDIDDYLYYSTIGRQVFMRTTLNCEERARLIYDFSLETGDSVSVFQVYSSPLALHDSVTYHVTNTGEMCFGGTNRKFLQVRYERGFEFYNTGWVEGIGDLNHPFPGIECVLPDYCERFYRVNCLSTQDSTLYSYDNEEGCAYDLSFLTRIYVDIDNTNSFQQDGRKWSQAFSSLQDAIAIADYGDSIWVAEGTYHPTDLEERSAYFDLKNGVKIFGGFNGAEEFLEERDWMSFPSVLSGEIGDISTKNDNSFHVVHCIGLDSTTILDGFTIQDGYANGTGIDRQGAAVLVNTTIDDPITEPLFRNCSMINNEAQNYGGAVSCQGMNGRYAVPSFENCNFRENNCFFGSAVYKTGLSKIGNPQRFENCLFEDNVSTDGGTVYLENVCNGFIFDHCTFNRDSSFIGSGGIQILGGCEQTSLEIKDCVFSNNKGAFGAGLAVNSGFDPYITDFLIRINNTTFINNSSRNDDGGAIIINVSMDTLDIKMDSVIFENNTASANGGAIAIIVNEQAAIQLAMNRAKFINNWSGSQGGGAVNISTFPSLVHPSFFKTTITNSLFTKNRGLLTMAPGVNGRVELEMLNCTTFDNGEFIFAKTWAPSFDTTYRTAIATIENCIIWEPNLNTQRIFYNGNIDTFNVYGYHLRNNLMSTSICDLEGCDSADLGGNIYGLNPLFINEETSNLRLRSCSPAINQGDTSSTVLSEYLYDLDGFDRILEDSIDIGAYETLSFNLNPITELISSSGEQEMDGEIRIDSVLGGSIPYAYEWSNGDTTAHTSSLSSGLYYLTITDSQGCQQEFEYFLDFTVDTEQVLENSSILIFPNPLKQGQVLNIDSQENIESILISNSLGELLWKGSLLQFSKLKFPAGLLNIHFHTSDDQWANRRLLVIP